MRIQRTLPPTAAALSAKDLCNGFKAFLARAGFLERLEEDVARYFSVCNAFFVSSGKAALFLILKVLKGISPERDEVIIPAYTCFSVPSAVVKARLRITLCDINQENFDYDYTQLEKIIGEKTLCVLVPHLFGIPSDTERIMKMCKAHGIFVVEDGAQAMGAPANNGKLVGTLADVGFFSLGRGKPVTCGSGGIIITDSEPIARGILEEYSYLAYPGIAKDIIEFLKALALTVFIHPSLYWIPSGLPFLGLGETIFYEDFPVMRLSEMQAGLALDWRGRLASSMRARSENVEKFCQGLGRTHPFGHGKRALPLLRLPVLLKNGEKKKAICESARESGLGITAMYPAPIHEIPEVKSQFSGEYFPSAKSVSERLVTIPTHEFVTPTDIIVISRFLNAHEYTISFNAAVSSPAAELN